MAILNRFGPSGGWQRELALAATWLGVGAALMPILIFSAGASLLGRYEGASLGRTFAGFYGGLNTDSVASWIVLLGPYGLYRLFRALRAWWQLGNGQA